MTAEEYDAAAWEYYRTLPMEHFMEATPQATQREIALASFALLKTRRGDVKYFSELLVQYWFGGELRRVVPDNMLVISPEPDRPRTSYATALEPAAPFMMLEWVSDSSEGKDYGDCFQKYERELRTPYCLTFHPDQREWRVYRHDGQRYLQLEPDLSGRVEIPELELPMGLLEGWLRFWHRGELLDLPAELQQRLDELWEELQLKSEQLSQQARQIHNLEQSMGDMLQRLRRLAEDRARQASRPDILEQIPSADFAQLERWLREL
jgi:Uma2 family endonuclease